MQRVIAAAYYRPRDAVDRVGASRKIRSIHRRVGRVSLPPFPTVFDALEEPLHDVNGHFEALKNLPHDVNGHFQTLKNFLHDVNGDFQALEKLLHDMKGHFQVLKKVLYDVNRSFWALKKLPHDINRYFQALKKWLHDVGRHFQALKKPLHVAGRTSPAPKNPAHHVNRNFQGRSRKARVKHQGKTLRYCRLGRQFPWQAILFGSETVLDLIWDFGTLSAVKNKVYKTREDDPHKAYTLREFKSLRWRLSSWTPKMV